jgi:TolB protein
VLAVETLDGIHLIDGLGRDRRLPGTSRGDQNPRWSPDGRVLLFWHGRLFGPTGDEWVNSERADGTDRRRLTAGEFPVWSPDGRRIAFESTRSADGNQLLYVMNADGSGVHRVRTGKYAVWTLDWSPDGKWLVFTALTGLHAERYRLAGLAAVHPDGTGLRRLRTLSPQAYQPSWSPDGRSVAYLSIAGGKGEIAVTAADGRGSDTAITHNRVKDRAPIWTPDGRHILFSSGRDGLYEVFAMRPDGAAQRRLTRFPTIYACCGVWRPEPGG